MGSNSKKKAGKKAKSKKKAKKKAKKMALQKANSKESSEKSYEYRPFTEAEERLLDAMSNEKLMRPTEYDYDIGWYSDEEYMLALTGNINLSEEKMRQFHKDKSERFKYFMKYGMFEDEWLQLKIKYPDEFVGEFPSKEHKYMPVILMLNVDTEKTVPISTSGSRSTDEFPHNELDAKPESLLKESPTVTSDSGIAVCTKTPVLVEEDTEKAVPISTSGSGSTCGFPHNAKPESLVKESPTETCHIGIAA